jgi:hypothetical protein
MTLVAQRVADGRVLTLIEQTLTAGYMEQGRLFSTPQGTPQGGVVSPLLSNILLTPFDREMRRRGYQLTRYADDWAVTCRSRREAEAALRCAEKILATLGVRLNLQKTRIVHVSASGGPARDVVVALPTLHVAAQVPNRRQTQLDQVGTLTFGLQFPKFCKLCKSG